MSGARQFRDRRHKWVPERITRKFNNARADKVGNRLGGWAFGVGGLDMLGRLGDDLCLLGCGNGGCE